MLAISSKKAGSLIRTRTYSISKIAQVLDYHLVPTRYQQVLTSVKASLNNPNESDQTCDETSSLQLEYGDSGQKKRSNHSTSMHRIAQGTSGCCWWRLCTFIFGHDMFNEFIFRFNKLIYVPFCVFSFF